LKPTIDVQDEEVEEESERKKSEKIEPEVQSHKKSLLKEDTAEICMKCKKLVSNCLC